MVTVTFLQFKLGSMEADMFVDIISRFPLKDS